MTRRRFVTYQDITVTATTTAAVVVIVVAVIGTTTSMCNFPLMYVYEPFCISISISIGLDTLLQKSLVLFLQGGRGGGGEE